MSQRQPPSVGRSERGYNYTQKDDYNSSRRKKYVIQEQTMPFDDEPPYDHPAENVPAQTPTMTSLPEDPMTSHPGSQAEVASYTARHHVTSYPGSYQPMTSLPVLTYSEVRDARPIFYTDDAAKPYMIAARRNTASKISTFSSNPLCVQIPSETHSARYVGAATPRFGPTTPILAPVGYYPHPNVTMVRAYPVTEQKREKEKESVCCRCPCLTVLMLGIGCLMVGGIIAIIILIKYQ